MGILSLKILRLRITNFKAENTITVFRKAPAAGKGPRGNVSYLQTEERCRRDGGTVKE
jgi:hypothetical protein